MCGESEFDLEGDRWFVKLGYFGGELCINGIPQFRTNDDDGEGRGEEMARTTLAKLSKESLIDAIILMLKTAEEA